MASSALSASVLLLNSSYQALRVINPKRAFSLLCREMAQVLYIEQDSKGESKWHNLDFSEWTELSVLKAEFEPEQHDWIHTARIQIAVPRIIRLLGYSRLPKETVKFNRRNLYARDGNRCQYCGKKFRTNDLSLDHVIPKSKGGRATWENMVCACLKCNTRKGGRTPKEANMPLHTKPIKPKRSPIITIQLAEERYTSWKQFMDAAYWSVELK